MADQEPSFPTVTFSVHREYLGTDGLWNPDVAEPPLEGGLQVNVFGSRAHYLRLAEAIRRFAEKDTTGDSDFHEHFGGIFSLGGKVRLHLILRKDDAGNSSWKGCFPPRL